MDAALRALPRLVWIDGMPSAHTYAAAVVSPTFQLF